MKDNFLKIKRFFKKANDDHISEYAAECAYFTILSFIPFILFFITLLQFTSINKETLLETLKIIIPTSMSSSITKIIEEIYSKSVKTISLSIIVALWSASRGFYALCKGLGEIYKEKNYNSSIIARIKGFFYTLLFIFILIGVLILMVFGNRIQVFLASKVPSLEKILESILQIRVFVTFLVLFIFFVFIYKLVPNHKMSIKSQLPGAIISSILWIISSYIFSIYINVFKGFSNTYGSLTSLILIMMWVYVCMYIILIGAEINTVVREYKYQKLNSKNEN